MLRHIVLFRIHEGLSEEKIEESIRRLTELDNNNPKIKEWTITKSLDTRKGIVIVENSLFESEEAFQEFRVSEKHLKTVEYMKTVCDWLVGDYLEN